MEKEKRFSGNWLSKTWHRLPVIMRAILTGFAVSTLGVMTWSLMGTTLPLPWPFILMLPFLWAYISFFSGRWGSKDGQKKRRNLFRKTRLSPKIWWLSLLAALMIVVIEQSGLVITFRIIEFPADRFLEEYQFVKALPNWVGWLVIIMISAVAGICEEIGFRGYMQKPLEKRYSPILAITIVSLVFVLVHLHQAWSGPILLQIFFVSALFGSIAYYSRSLIPGVIAHFLMDVCNFAFWWTDLGGQFEQQTVHETGIDLHFVLWLMALVLSLIFYIVLLQKLYKQYQKAPMSLAI